MCFNIPMTFKGILGLFSFIHDNCYISLISSNKMSIHSSVGNMWFLYYPLHKIPGFKDKFNNSITMFKKI